MATLIYPEDRTGVAVTNKVPPELHSVAFAADADFHFFIPTFAPYFASGFRLVQVISGNRIPLIEGADYHHGLRFFDASESTAKPIYGGVVLMNMSQDAVYEIESYQTLGGTWVLDTQGMLEAAANIVKNPRALSWEQVTELPVAFNPTDHLWKFSDMVGQSEVVQALMAIANAIVSRTVNGNNHHLIKGNPHDLSRYDLGLDKVPNFGVATLPLAIAGTSNETLITPMLLRQVLQSLGLLELAALATAMRQHLNDKDNPHETNAVQVQRGNLPNLPLASSQEIARNLNADALVSLAGMKQWFSLHGGQLVEATSAPIPLNSLLSTYCTAEKDRMGIYADGKGGTFEKIVILKDIDCGYQSEVPIQFQPKGAVLSSYCDGNNLMNIVSDGKGSSSLSLAERNSSKCVQVSYPPAGSLISSTCEGSTLVRQIANGTGGSDFTRTENSSQCDTTVHPARGTLITYKCLGKDMVGTFADGVGGSYEGVLERNSTDCGYVAPTASPQPTYPPQGTVLGTSCAGYNLQEIRANGVGGSYTVTTVVNSPDCGYVPTPAPTVNPTNTPTPTSPPDRIGTLSFSSTLSNIWIGDLEVLTVWMNGWKPNSRYTLQAYGRSPALGDNLDHPLASYDVTTDSSGNGTLTVRQTETGTVPPGRYESWFQETTSGRASNTLVRIFRGSR